MQHAIENRLARVPDGIFYQIHHIRSKFVEIEKHRIALRLLEEDGPRNCITELQIAPTSHIIDESDIFGREGEKEKLIDLLLSETESDKVVSVVAIVGPGGLGKTTLAQLAFNNHKTRKGFDKLGWICVSDNFDVEKLTKESVETITQNACGLTNLSAMQEKLRDAIRGKRVLLVLDDVWNEKSSLWNSFHAPFKSALFAKFLVTTRNEPVAKIMQTMPTFYLGYMPKEQCWKLFEHHAFCGVNRSEGSKLEEIGKQIFKKCGMLPLAVKSIASLLRHEMKEESWREILESELWESHASSEIFPPLQLSYVRLPTVLKPCFIFCSMFPKDYIYHIEKLVKFWVYQGYVDSKGNKSAEEIGREYARQLWQRSFFESEFEWNNGQDRFKLHDMIHDLARLNSKNECCSIEASMAGKLPVFGNELCHLYVRAIANELCPFEKLTTLRHLRTLVIMGLDPENSISTFDLSLPQRLRVLEIYVRWSYKLGYTCLNYEEIFFPSVSNLKHLCYLSLGNFPFKKLPECICSLYNLQYLKLHNCDFDELPKGIGNLLNLSMLVMSFCDFLEWLPESLCQLKTLKELILECKRLKELPTDMGSLTNLQYMYIYCDGVHSLPSSLGKIVGTSTLCVRLVCEKIGWLKDFVDLGGTLSFDELRNVSNLTDVQCANLVSMHNLEFLKLYWNHHAGDVDDNQVSLKIKRGQELSIEDQDDYVVMAGLQPHCNLRKLCVSYYAGSIFPEWISNPGSCMSLERLDIENCKNLRLLPFGSLCKLKYLRVIRCDSLQIIRSESLPPKLQELTISHCNDLKSVPAILKLKSLVSLCITFCENLHFLVTDVEPPVELTISSNEATYQNSLLGLRILTSLRSLKIHDCHRLQLLMDELLCVQSCKVEVENCPLLRKWCLQHDIDYEDIPWVDKEEGGR